MGYAWAMRDLAAAYRKAGSDESRAKRLDDEISLRKISASASEVVVDSNSDWAISDVISSFSIVTVLIIVLAMSLSCIALSKHIE